jgi:hypothetical protein
MTIAPGHRFEATQALRQVLARAVAWGMIDVNPAKQGVDNPQRRRTDKRPFESWAQLAAVASRLGECSGALVMFAAATGLRPGEWIALERRDIDLAARVVYVRRAYRNGRLKCTKTEGSVRAVPLQEIALDAIARLPTRADTDLLFPSLRGTYFDLHNFRTREWKPAQLAVGITPLRRVYDLRHTFATFALRAGISTFDLPLHGRQPDHDRPPLRTSRPRWTRPRNQTPGRLQPASRRRCPPGGRRVDTSAARRRPLSQQKNALAGEKQKPSDGLEPSTLLTIFSRQRVATCGNGFGLIRGFWARVICERLPPVATTGLHKGSIRVVRKGNTLRRCSSGWGRASSSSTPSPYIVLPADGGTA